MTRSPFETRRRLLRGGALFAGAALAAPAARLFAQAGAPTPGAGYGPLRPVRDLNTGLPLVALPAGFSYVTFGWVHEALDGDEPTPGAHDGMGVVRARGSVVTLVRNHEIVGDLGAFGPDRVVYDKAAGGGCTAIAFDTATGKAGVARAVLGGTVQNCSGGATPWGTWLSCEEFIHEPHARGALDRIFAPLTRLRREHGFVFEVDPDGRTKPEPIVGMGQFRHEAAVVHTRSGAVYLTEDREPEAGFYRYVPKTPGRLHDGGKLQMLKVAGATDLRGGFARGTTWKTGWVDIDDPDHANSAGTRDGLGVLRQGVAQGGAIFTRLEGAYANGDAIYFTATNGGAGACGQVYAYYPDAERLTLVFESDSQDQLDYPDNVCFSPRGGLVLCEDGDRRGMLIQGLSAAGELFPLARNNVILDGNPNGIVGDFRSTEWAGACFSPDGKWLFANVYHPGFSIAITGPWKDGLV
jgi:hypothetical protein